MNEDRAFGSATNLGGKVEEGVGRALGDTKMQAGGIADQAAGTAQEFYGQLKDGASDAAQAVRQGTATAEDYIRHAIEERPYTTALLALCVGWLIGRTGRRT